MNIFNHITLHPDSIIYQHGIKREEMAFNDIIEIALVTTSDGPFTEDVFAVLKSAQQKITIPQNAENFDAVFDMFKKFDGFNYEAFIDAMSSAENATFICWQKNASK